MWVGRQAFMRRSDADGFAPFAFPPVALVAGFLAARATAAAVLLAWGARSQPGAQPLVPSPGTRGYDACT